MIMTLEEAYKTLEELKEYWPEYDDIRQALDIVTKNYKLKQLLTDDKNAYRVYKG